MYNELHILKVYYLMSFAICIHLGNPHYNKGNEHLHHSQVSLFPCTSFLLHHSLKIPLIKVPGCACFSSTYIEIGMIQLLKDDTQICDVFHIFKMSLF